MRRPRVRCASPSAPSSSKAARSSPAATTTTARTTTARRCARAGTASPYRCTRRCTRSSVTPACRPRSASSARVRAQAPHRSCKHRALHARPRPHLHPHHRLKARRPSPHVRGTPTASARSPSRTTTGKRSSSSSKRKPARREEQHGALGDCGGRTGRAEDGEEDEEEEESGVGGAGGKRRARGVLGGACWTAGGSLVVEVEKAWSARRRDPRINGADIYVARVTKVGMGSARPCWRCVEWCRWAGVKRIFHWNGEEGKFDVVKVNTAERDQYETHADIRLFAGMVSCRLVLIRLSFSDGVFVQGW